MEAGGGQQEAQGGEPGHQAADGGAGEGEGAAERQDGAADDCVAEADRHQPEAIILNCCSSFISSRLIHTMNHYLCIVPFRYEYNNDNNNVSFRSFEMQCSTLSTQYGVVWYSTI